MIESMLAVPWGYRPPSKPNIKATAVWRLVAAGCHKAPAPCCGHTVARTVHVKAATLGKPLARDG